MTTVWPSPVDPDKAWADRKARYRETVPYGCRRCLRAGLRGDPDLWLDCHHPWGRGKRYEVGNEPDHALMWLCQEHHDSLHRVHNAACRRFGIMGAPVDGSTIHHPAIYSVTLYVWSMAYVLVGRAMLTSGARAAMFLTGGWLALWLGPAFALLILVWPMWYLWRK